MAFQQRPVSFFLTEPRRQAVVMITAVQLAAKGTEIDQAPEQGRQLCQRVAPQVADSCPVESVPVFERHYLSTFDLIPRSSPGVLMFCFRKTEVHDTRFETWLV